MAIHPAYRTAKQGKDDARKAIERAKAQSTDELTGRMNGSAYYSRIVFALAARFGTRGAAHECTTAYRRAFFDRLSMEV
jgi:hypothetical protein